MSYFNSKKIKFFIILIIVIAGTVMLVFNDFGILKYLELKKQVDSLNIKIQKIEDENRLLKSQIDSLEKKIPFAIEKSARENYGMKKKNEATIQVIEK